MRILYICSEYPPFAAQGGIGSFTKVLAEALTQKGHETFVVGIYENDIRNKVVEVSGVTIFLLKNSRIKFKCDLVNRIRLFLFVKYLIRKYNIDIIESGDYMGYTALWSGLKIPLVIRMHGSATFLAADMSTTVPVLIRFFEACSLKRADAIIGVSRYIFQRTRELFSLPEKPTFVLTNPVIVKESDVYSKVNNLVVFSGTLMRLKGVFSLIEAWKLVVAAVPSARLYCYGKDTYEQGISVLQTLKGMLDQKYIHTVKFKGHVSQQVLFEKLATAEIAVFPSYTESCGLAPLEAMASKCATIFTSRASGPEIIEHGVDGILVDPSKPAKIAESIIYLLQNKSRAREIAAAGADKIRSKFSYERIVDENEIIYKELVGACAAGRKNQIR